MAISIVVNKAYLIPFGLLKCVEFITLLIGWAAMADFIPIRFRSSKMDYFIAIGVIAWLFVILWFTINVLKLTEKIQIGAKNIMFSIPHFVLSVLLLIAAGLLGDVFKYHNTMFWSWDKAKAAVSFHIIAALVLLFDGVIHIALGKTLYGGVDVTTTTATA